MRQFYLYSERFIQKTIKEVFFDFDIHAVSKEVIKKDNFINKNILMILTQSLPENLNEYFFLKNKVVLFFLNQNHVNKNKYYNTKIFNAHININKFTDEVITFFSSKTFIYKDIKIFDEKIINTKAGKEAFLTALEKNILILLFEKKKIEKDFLLVNVLNLKKNLETKTIESHLTRIRKKLLSVNSQIEIISKDNTVFLIN